MRIQTTTRRVALVAAAGTLLLPGSAGFANDTDLFRTNVPPNIMLLIDNSSSMTNSVVVPEFEDLVMFGGSEIRPEDQTECEFFRDLLGTTKITIHIAPVRSTLRDGNGEKIRYSKGDSENPPAYLLDFPIEINSSGDTAFEDADVDGVRDDGEYTLYYNVPDPTQDDEDWDDATINDKFPVYDIFGERVFYDVDGDGEYEPGDGDRQMSYKTKNNGKVKGSVAKIASRAQPADKILRAGVDPIDLDFTFDGICGQDPASSGWSLWDGSDPLAAVQGKTKVVSIRPAYLDWLFSSLGDAYRAPVFAPTEGNDGIRAKSACVSLVGGESATYETYRRSRLQALTQILRRVICEVNQVGEVRFGFAQFRYAGKGGDDNGGYVAVPINDWFDDAGDPNTYSLHGVTASHEEHLRRVIRTSTPDAQTPLAEALFQIYTYFMSREVQYLPVGKLTSHDGDSLVFTDTSTKFPVYDYDTSLYNPLLDWDNDLADDDPTYTPPNILDVGGLYVGPDPLDPTVDASADAPPDPLLYPCQKNFVLYITDGEPSGDDFSDNDDKIIAHGKFNLDDSYETHTDIGFSDFWDLIGDHYLNADGTADETEETGGTGWRYLDDVAYFMNTHDFRPDENDMPGVQTLDVYTVGYALEGGTDFSLVERAALRANGKYFESSDADELAEDIVAAITDMIDKAQAFTSATVPASRTTDGNNFYSSFFLPKEDTGFWEGHLKNFSFTSQGYIVTPSGKCATGDDINAEPPCTGGALRTFERGHWDAAEVIPDPYDRKLYAEDGSDDIFDQPYRIQTPTTAGEKLAAALALGLDAGDALEEPYDALSPNTPSDMAVALIDTLQGCEFGVDPCEPRLNDADEKIYLGDIFHSNPVVVGSPNSPINEVSYKEFAIAKRDRPRVIYAGANDGFVHGFHAGTWRTVDEHGDPLKPPRHDRGTGEELMGFMPYAVRNVIKQLPKETTFPRAMETVDGSPMVADTWFYRNVVSGDLTTVNPTLTPDDEVDERWRTVLIAGLRNGGQQYFALDITDPPDSASVSTSDYPRYLWGFPCEQCGNAVNGTTAGEATYMGFSWSEPVITRVRVRGDASTDPGEFDRWVAIFGAGYSEHGDPNSANYKVPADVDFSPRGRGIYMVDITTGQVLARKIFDEAATALSTTPQVAIREFHYAFASAPAVFDIDFDGYADVVYIGDLGGQLWKWVISEPGDDPINNASYNAEPSQPRWPFSRIFKAETSDIGNEPGERTGGSWDSSIHYQSFFFPPTGVKRGGKLLLAFGSGERANAKGPDTEWGDGDPTNNNHYYVIKDVNPLEIGSAADVDYDPIDDSIVEGDLDDLEDGTALTCSEMQATRSGYFITGRDAEKFITNSVIFLGTVFTGSFLPPNPANAGDRCAASGNAYLYAFDVDCGVGRFTAHSGASEKRRKAIGSGIPTRPRVSVGDLNQGGEDGGGCANRVIVITSDGFIENECTGSVPGRVNVRSWRERQ